MNYKGFFKVTGVDALNFCSISEGNFDVLIETGLKLVDIMPIVLIVKIQEGTLLIGKESLIFLRVKFCMWQ